MTSLRFAGSTIVGFLVVIFVGTLRLDDISRIRRRISSKIYDTVTQNDVLDVAIQSRVDRHTPLRESDEHTETTTLWKTYREQSQGGFKKLPAEIIAFIFELACHRSRRGHITLSHVSRRFRDAAISTKSLWAFVDAGMSQNFLLMHLQRSRGYGHNVSFSWQNCRHRNFTYDGMRCAEFFLLVSEYCDQWKSFVWSHVMNHEQHGNLDREYSLSALRRRLSGLHCPELRCLEIEGNEFVEGGKGTCLFTDICNSWTMPNLRRISVRSGHILLQYPNPNLKSISFVHSFIRDSDIRRNLDFFAKMSRSLEEIEIRNVLHLDGTIREISDVQDDTDLPSVHLPVVKTFAMNVRLCNYVSCATLCPLFHSCLLSRLVMPGAKVITMKFWLPIRGLSEQIPNFIAWALRKEHVALEELRLAFGYEGKPEEDVKAEADGLLLRSNIARIANPQCKIYVRYDYPGDQLFGELIEFNTNHLYLGP